jgi:hypothetical protein
MGKPDDIARTALRAAPIAATRCSVADVDTDCRLGGGIGPRRRSSAIGVLPDDERPTGERPAQRRVILRE